jgi:hypothetical protein
MQPTSKLESNVALIVLAIFKNAKLRQSPGASEGVAGTMPAAGSLPGPDHFSTI